MFFDPHFCHFPGLCSYGFISDCGKMLKRDYPSLMIVRSNNDYAMMHCQQALYSHSSSTKSCDRVLHRLGKISFFPESIFSFYMLGEQAIKPFSSPWHISSEISLHAHSNEQQNRGRRSDVISGTSSPTRYPSCSVFDSGLGFSGLRLVQFRRRERADFP